MTCLKKDEGRRLGIGGTSGMSRSGNSSTLPKIIFPSLIGKATRAADIRAPVSHAGWCSRNSSIGTPGRSTITTL